MARTIDSILQEECRLDKARPILAGVSGGPDSLCLLHMLHDAGWRVIATHFDHMLRPESGNEAEAVGAAAKALGVACVAGQADVRREAAQAHLSIEAAARCLRYRFLFEQARAHDAQAVAVGHTADDQVETVLMHLLRGAGLNGLTGMSFRTILTEFDADLPLVRPLLEMWRSETLAYCESRGLQPRYDPSNDSLDYLRNRVRHDLLPTLETYNPRAREALWRTSRTLQVDHDLLDAAVEMVWNRVLGRQGEGYVELRRNALAELPPGAAAHVLRRGVALLAPGNEVDYADLQRAKAFLSSADAERMDFTGGLFLLREADRLYLASNEGSLPTDEWPQMPGGMDAIPFTPPYLGELAAGWRFAAQVQESAASSEAVRASAQANPFQAWICDDDLPGSLALRVRAPGDRFEPFGLGGHAQKLSDFMVNEKIPARLRARWPLVCAGERVLWVPGYRTAESLRLREGVRQVLHLAIWRPG